MKKLLLSVFALLISIPSLAQLTEAERTFAIDYLNSTHKNIVELVKDLPEESFNYKPEDGAWSVSNALEHILLTEAAFSQMGKGTLQNPEAKTGKDLSEMDAVHIGRLANRGTKVKTAAPFEPSGKWDTKEKMLAELEISRKMLTDYLNSTDDDLRSYTANLPVGEIDMYQLYLVVAAHSQRHTFQMQEVLAGMDSM